MAGGSSLVHALPALSLGQCGQGISAADVVPVQVELVESNLLLPELLPS
jgi:hypothetical protein